LSVVLITGCSSGFGLEAALAFARRGDTVYATMRNLAKSDRLRGRADAEGLPIELLALDVDEDASVSAAIGEVESSHGAIDVLVNNAGVGYEGPVETIDIDLARALMETNLWGAVRTIRAVLPAMRARASGVIINVTSVAARLPGTAYNGWYGASKHALSALSEAMVVELDGFGVRVACIEPGFFSTEIGRNRLVQRSTEGTDGTDPYAADQAWLADFYLKSSEGSGGDPVVVAEAIVQAAVDPATPLHNLVGDDAAMFLDVVEQAGSLEAWIPIGTSIAESVSGPRPPR
jgi:NAD(P)-dependent dehydrogenase (short-subunit alcohol dehydrogenase family)